MGSVLGCREARTQFVQLRKAPPKLGQAPVAFRKLCSFSCSSQPQDGFPQPDPCSLLTGEEGGREQNPTVVVVGGQAPVLFTVERIG